MITQVRADSRFGRRKRLTRRDEAVSCCIDPNQRGCVAGQIQVPDITVGKHVANLHVSRDTNVLQSVAALVGALPDMPIEPTWIKEGAPVARGRVVTQSEDKKVSSGLWSCEPGKFKWTFSWDEFVHILEGEVDITEDGTENTVTLRSGDMAHFPLVMKTH